MSSFHWIAAICHAPWILIGNAGGEWLDQAMLESPGLVTSR